MMRMKKTETNTDGDTLMNVAEETGQELLSNETSI